jgi:hypothetical protein
MTHKGENIMAKVRHNIVIQGLSGSLGDQLVIKQSRSGRTIVSAKPSFSPNREFSEAQKAQREAFREATAYARSAQGHTAYVRKAEGSDQTPYTLAVADWFHAPQVLDVDLSGWSGQAGQPIRVKAMDDVQVTQVTVVITDENGVFCEQGEAAPAEGLWWEYTSMAAGGSQVSASARDLPGHSAEMVKVK